MIKNEGEQESCCCSAAAESCCEDEPVEEPCCAEGSPCCAGGGGESSLTSIREAFGAFMGEVNSPGALGLREKELVSVALSVLSKCEPCVKIHVKKACEAGLTQAEVDEAVWMAIAFGGAPTMMFYNGIRK
ncbi:MAG: carboxymuconolactone decarboxylase family protein [Armatimonadia bacterium]